MLLFLRMLSVPFIALFLGACSSPSEDQQTAQPPEDAPFVLDADAIAANNRGVGLMGRFEYAQAAEVFRVLAEKHPKWLDVQVNLAIATLNRQQEGDEVAALAIADRVLEVDPTHLRADYVAGLLRLYLQSPAAAMKHFQRVAEGDPQDGYAAYYLAQCLAQESAYEPALQRYQRALELDPYLRSAYYGAFQTLQRLKRRDEARELVLVYQRLGNNPRARLAEFKYTRMGPKAEALAVGLAGEAPRVRPEGPVFSEPLRLEVTPRPVWARDGDARPASLTVVDLQGDGRLDLFISNALANGEARNLLLVGQETLNFAPDLEHPLARVSAVNAALWGDFDNDGLVDVYLCRRGVNQLWRQVAAGNWEDVTESTGTGAGERDTVAGAFFDADHDGDLDLFVVNADGPNELLNNNRDGSFRPLASEQGIAGEDRASRAVVPVDLDGDRDVDIIVINAEPPHEVYLNDRLWAYHPAPSFENFQSRPVLAALAADLDADGFAELYSLETDGGLYRWQSQPAGGVTPERLAKTGLDGSPWAQLAVLDVDGNGHQEIITATRSGWQVTDPASVESLLPYVGKMPKDAPMRGITPILLDSGSGPAMVGLGAAGELMLWGPGPGRYAYLGLTLSGREDNAQSMRSNASGVGTRVAVRVGSRWTALDTFLNPSGPGQGQQPLAVGLGGETRADFIAIDWSDGVFQSELDLGARQVHRIAETQRQLSSCPVLFAWDGQRYAFVADLLGVGGIGYAIGPGEYATPRPWENLLLPAGLLKARAGQYLLKLTEPMEEVGYLDSARLVAYDLPADWQMVLDERMGIRGPEPTGEPRFYRRELLPERASNERGEMVTEALLSTDRRAAPVGELDRRFIGRLRHEHVLTLRFPKPLDGMPGKPLLVMDGWVEYPYSQTSFAAWQARASFDPPSLEVRGNDQVWQPVLKQFGYPAGMPRRMSVPLEGLPEGARMLRLRTNLQVYWDRIAVAYAEDTKEVRRVELPLARARLAKAGFPLRTTHAQHRPHYDYGRRSPFWDARYMAGWYTRLGPVEELLGEVDDAVAIFGPGEEIHLAYQALEASPPPGGRRYFVLETNGWTKDMDLFTQHAETVDPLPAVNPGDERRELLHARYNTRYQAGY